MNKKECVDALRIYQGDGAFDAVVELLKFSLDEYKKNMVYAESDDSLKRAQGICQFLDRLLKDVLTPKNNEATMRYKVSDIAVY